MNNGHTKKKELIFTIIRLYFKRAENMINILGIVESKILILVR